VTEARRWSRRRRCRAAGCLAPIVGAGEGMEPIGQRIIEVPDDPILTTLRDWRIGFTTYVPPGSVKKGETLVTTGATAGRAVHHLPRQRPPRYRPVRRSRGGRHLHVPPAVRLQGRRAARRVVGDDAAGGEELTLDDMIAIVAYTSSKSRNQWQSAVGSGQSAVGSRRGRP